MGIRRKTHQEFLKEVESKYGKNHSFVFIKEYSNSKTQVKIQHTTCGHTWEISPDKFLNSKNPDRIPCAKCRKKFYEEVLLSKEINKINSGEYSVIGDCFGKYILTLVKHDIENCGYEYFTTLNKLTSKKNSCPSCRLKKELEIFSKLVQEKEGDNYSLTFELDEESIRYKIKHNTCGTMMETSLKKYKKQGIRCNNPECSKQANKHNFTKLVHEKYGEEFIVLGEYQGSDIKIKVKHNIDKCGKEYDRIPKHFLYGKGLCPHCKSSFSKGENRIMNMLNENNVKFKKEMTFAECRDTNTLRFDFGIYNNDNTFSYLIEYDGRHHFEPVDFANKGEDWAKEQFLEIKRKDEIKNKYCADNDIRLVRIPYFLDNHIETIVEKVLKNELIELDDSYIVTGLAS